MAKNSLSPQSLVLSTLGHRRRGIIFITALWIAVLLAGMVLVLCHSMTTEMLASGNRSNDAEVDAIERGVEQYVLCQVDGCRGDAVTVTQAPAEAMPLGGGYFWILRPWPDNDQDYGYGITDEASKINLNTATYQQMQNAPNVSTDVAAAIFSWCHDPAAGSKITNAAESDYYASLTDFPYNAKNYAFDTVEELMLVRDVSKEVMFGADLNRDGYVSQDELSQSNNDPAYSSAQNAVYTDTRGLFNFVTVSSTDPNMDVNGNKRVNVNDFNALSTYLKTKSGLDQAVVNTLLRNIQGRYGGQTGGKSGGTAKPQAASGTTPSTPITTAGATPTVFQSLADFYRASQLTPADMAKVFDSLTAKQGSIKGLVNVNTAPQQVLQALPGLEQSDAQSIVGQRSSGNSQNGAGAGWVFNAITDKNKAYTIADSITGESYQYSADIVAVSGDGRTFKRVRVVVDGSKSPAVITYRRDLTSYGWPLKPEIRQQMKEGKFVSNTNGNEPAQGQLDNGLNSLQ